MSYNCSQAPPGHQHVVASGSVDPRRSGWARGSASVQCVPRKLLEHKNQSESRTRGGVRVHVVQGFGRSVRLLANIHTRARETAGLCGL